tara:strand:- start:1111 stop:2247 length:1137 start_codon:yes stop_codon:yes gene_type:complete
MTVKESSTIFLCAGGTGGHVMPAEALAQELLKRGYQVHFITDKRGRRYIEDEGLSVTLLSVNRRPGISGKILYLWSLLKSFFVMWRLITRKSPSVLVSFGGYISFPANLAAFIRGISFILHEQNAYMGLVNRFFAFAARHIALSMPVCNKPSFISGKKMILTGMPVRSGFYKVAKNSYVPISKSNNINVLVIGGSQGASIFSDIIPKAFATLPEELQRKIKLSLQTRENILDSKSQRGDCRETFFQLETAPFFTDMDMRLKQAHLVIARAGASSVAEFAVAGRPAILVPYPYAAGNHQYYNARDFVVSGAGWLFKQDQLTVKTLSDFLRRLFQSPSALTFAAERARTQRQGNATFQLAEYVQKAIIGSKAFALAMKEN